MIFRTVWVLSIIPFIILLYVLLSKRRSGAVLKVSTVSLLTKYRPSIKIVLARWLWVMPLSASVLIAVALARPSMPLDRTVVHAEGVDIVLAVDASGSMLAEDFTLHNRRVNRLEIVKSVVDTFISKRKYDRIGLVAFAGRAYTVCPMTLDYNWLKTNLDRVNIGDIEDGTAIGSAISSALNRLRGSDAKSKVIILLTDGVNNAGKVPPLTAAEAAEALGVKIYTIGAGSRGPVPYPMTDPFGRTVYQNVKIDIDDKMLTDIARTTGGRYYRATDTASLENIYDEIDRLEKTEFEERGFVQYRELFPGWVMAAIVLLFIETLLTATVLLKVP